MKTVLFLLVAVLAVVALVVFLSRRASQRKLALSRENAAIRAQVESDLAAYRKARIASDTRTITSGTPVRYTGGVAKPVTSKPSPKPKAVKKDYSSDSDDTVYVYVAPDYGYSNYTDYSSGSSDSGSSGSSSSSGSSDSGYSSGESSSTSYDSGSSSSSSDSGSSSW